MNQDEPTKLPEFRLNYEELRTRLRQPYQTAAFQARVLLGDLLFNMERDEPLANPHTAGLQSQWTLISDDYGWDQALSAVFPEFQFFFGSNFLAFQRLFEDWMHTYVPVMLGELDGNDSTWTLEYHLSPMEDEFYRESHRDLSIGLTEKLLPYHVPHKGGRPLPADPEGLKRRTQAFLDSQNRFRCLMTNSLRSMAPAASDTWLLQVQLAKDWLEYCERASSEVLEFLRFSTTSDSNISSHKIGVVYALFLRSLNPQWSWEKVQQEVSALGSRREEILAFEPKFGFHFFNPHGDANRAWHVSSAKVLSNQAGELRRTILK